MLNRFSSEIILVNLNSSKNITTEMSSRDYAKCYIISMFDITDDALYICTHTSHVVLFLDYQWLLSTSIHM